MSKIARTVVVEDAQAFQKQFPYAIYGVDGTVNVASECAITFSVAVGFPQNDDGGALFGIVNPPSRGSAIVAARDIWLTGSVVVSSGNASAHVCKVVIGDALSNYGQDGTIVAFRQTMVANQSWVTIPISLPLKAGEGLSIMFEDTTVTPTGLISASSLTPL